MVITTVLSGTTGETVQKINIGAEHEYFVVFQKQNEFVLGDTSKI